MAAAALSWGTSWGGEATGTPTATALLDAPHVADVSPLGPPPSFDDFVRHVLLPRLEHGAAGAPAWQEASAAKELCARGSEGEPEGACSAHDAADWRCLYPGHPAECRRCLPPPPASEQSGWQLRSAAKGTKSGEKQLRMLLAHTPEWASQTARLAAAEQAAALGDAQLAAALRGRDLSSLRKANMMTLCAIWRYRSDTWSRRPAAVGRRAARRVAPAGHAVVSAAPPQRPAATPDADSMALCARLRGYCDAYVRMTADTHVHDAARHEPMAPMQSWKGEMFALILPAYIEFADAVSCDAAALAALRDGYGGAAGGAWGGPPEALLMPWWQQDSADALLTRADAHLLVISRMLHAHGAGTATLAATAASAPDRAAAAVWAGSNGVVGDFLAEARSAMLRARLAGRPEAHLSIAADVMAALASIVNYCNVVLSRRRDWAFARAGAPRPQGIPGPYRPGAGAAAPAQPGAFWTTFLAVAQGEAVPAARGAHPHIAGLIESAVHAVLAGATM